MTKNFLGKSSLVFVGNMMLRSVLRFCFLFTVYVCITPVYLVAQSKDIGQGEEHHLSPQEWREDLRYLAEQMRLKHKSLFHTMPEAEFKGAVAKLDADIPSLND